MQRLLIQLPLIAACAGIALACQPEGLSWCGDGVVDAEESCDDGDRNGEPGRCRADCTEPICGDGLLDPGEACDDGAANAWSQACTPECAVARCGDGHVFDREEDCDDGNDRLNDGCSPTCALPTRIDVTELTPLTSRVLGGNAESPGDVDADGIADIVSTDGRLLRIASASGDKQRYLPFAGSRLSRGQGRLLRPGPGADVVLGSGSVSEQTISILDITDNSVDAHTIRIPQQIGWLDHGMDVDGDGGPDLIMATSRWRVDDRTWPKGAVALITDPRATTFEPAALWLGPTEPDSSSIGRARLVSDADGDGRAEIVVSRSRGGPVWIRDPATGGRLEEAGPAIGDKALVVDGNCDLNDDGYADIASAAHHLETYLGRAEGFSASDRFAARVQTFEGPYQGVSDLECIPGEGPSRIAVSLVRFAGNAGYVAVLDGPLEGQLRISDAPLLFEEPEGSPYAGTGARVFGIPGFEVGGVAHVGFSDYLHGIYVEPLLE